MMFSVENGCFRYGGEKNILNGVNFSLPEGKILTILGSNGVGKTTLIKCMLGLLSWEKGRTLLHNQDISKMKYKDIWTQIGYVPQAKLSPFSYQTEEMVLLGRNAHLGLFTQPSEEDREIVRKVMQDVGILHLIGKNCRQISGGELQMVLIARALATKPKLLVLDEPESNLDFKNQLIVLNILQKLSKEQNIASIINTHYPQHAMLLSDYALLLGKKGECIFGKSEKIISEENLEKIFCIPVKIRRVDIDQGEAYPCVIPVGNRLSKEEIQ